MEDYVVGARKVARLATFSLGLLVASLMFATPVFAAGEWTFTSPTESTPNTGAGFHVSAVSSDGKYMYSSAHFQGVYRSINYGATWELTSGLTPQDYATITTSADGSKVYVLSYSGDIWYSSNFGVNWTKRTSPPQTGYKWAAIDTSDNGQITIAGTETEGLFVSNDYGLTFTATTLPTNKPFYGVAISADGNFMFATQYGGDAFTSTNAGSTWSSVLANKGFFEASASSTGKYLATISPGDGIFISSDFGQTWSIRPGTEAPYWYDIDMSADGKYMVAAVNASNIWASSDFGQTWINQTSGTANSGLNYAYVAISADGRYILATAPDDDLFVGYNATAGASDVILASSPGQQSKAGTLAETGIDTTKFFLMFFISSISLALIFLKTFMNKQHKNT